MSTMTSATQVYSGPSSGGLFPSIGSVSSGEAVTAIFRESGWIFIEYTVDGSLKKKRGYVLSSKVNLSESIQNFTAERVTRYANSAAQTFFGPNSTTCLAAGCVDRGEAVSYLGRKENGWAFIEYSVGSQRKRAYILASKLSTDLMFNYSTLKSGDLIPNGYPMAGATVTQGFNDKTTNHKAHLGYDLANLSYAKPLFAGTVVGVSTSITSANGRTVCVRHTLNGITFYSTYCHLASVSVSVNDAVTTNTTLGVVGGSGNGREDAYKTHVHVCTYTGFAETSPMGYCGGGTKTFEQQSSYANAYYYGADTGKFPNCGGLCFYDPYGVVTSKGTVIDAYHP